MSQRSAQDAPERGGMAASRDELALIDAYWRAANYVSVGQIYLLDNPLLREPLQPGQVKPRLIGHWGTTPGLNFIYAHLNRLIRSRDLDMIYVIGPGHGGPAAVANAYLEGTYSEVYPHIGRDEAGLRQLFRQFSFPGGIPSHVAPETPGSIHEGGELGYSLSHAYGAAFDNPDLVVCCIVGDGEAETGPLATGWHSNKFLDPVGDGAVLPILHLNGYKIANPTVLARIGDRELTSLLEGYGHTVHWVDGDEPGPMHERMASVLETVADEIASLQHAARVEGSTERPRWPMIVLRTPKGWTGPKMVDGLPAEGTWRSHQVPLAEVRTNPGHLALLEEWLRSYRPHELFDEEGALVPELVRPPSARPPADERQPARERRAAAGGSRPPRLLLLRDRRSVAGHDVQRGHAGARLLPARRDRAQPPPFPPVRTGRDGIQPAVGGVRGHRPRLGRLAARGRRPPRHHRPGDGGAVRASVPGLARGLSADGPARPLHQLRGVHPRHRLDVQPAREVAEGDARHPLAAPGRLAQLPAQLPRLAAGSQRLLAPGPRLHRPRGRTRRRRSSASTCRRTPTASCPWPPTAWSRATT